ncbi:MAG: tetratricopeptide repeat protein [Desulfamplus sp.]|nr:tetratricopeptide repeat protein [Desulfamplus sp.]
MAEMMARSLKVVVVFCILLCITLLATNRVATGAELKGIFSGDRQSEIQLQVTEKITGKVIMVDDKEILIALKNIRPSNQMTHLYKSNNIIRKIEIDELPGNVLAIVVTGKVPFKSVEHSWDKSGLNLTVKINASTPDTKIKSDENPKNNQIKSAKKSATKSTQPSKKPQKEPDDSVKLTSNSSQKKSQQQPASSQSSATPSNNLANKDNADLKNISTAQTAQSAKAKKEPINKGREGKVYGTRNNRLSEIAGDVTDIVGVANLASCSDDDLKKADMLLKQSQWQNSFDLLNSYIEKGKAECIEQAHYLRAYASYQIAVTNASNPLQKEDFQRLLNAENLFHNLIVNFGSSPLLPFAHASLGLIYNKLDNLAASEGHFTIVVDNYRASYKGIPEVIYYLAKIYDVKGDKERDYNDKAIDYYKEVFNNYSDSVYAVDAGVGLGKALFKKLHYIECRDILSSIVKSNPEVIYESPEVLLNLGEAEYALQNSEPARDNLTKVYNMFPDISDKDMVMTKVGDTYFHEKNLDRAKGVYRFVMDKYPGTEGFLGSAMGLALCIKDRTEIETIYSMVKEDFPDHRLSKVAMMRLAELYNTNGEYEKCIQEIENLLATHPTGLRYDAIKLMQTAYESLFKERLKSGEYPEVLKTYEGAKVLLDRLESQEIFLTTGLSYLDAHLYEQAFNQLMESYKLFKQNERPVELLFGLGVAMDESNKRKDALNVFKAYIDRVEDTPQKVEAYLRIGNILFDNGELTKAAKSFRDGYDASKDRVQKGNILSREAEVYQKLNQWKKVSALYEEAVTEYASATGKNYDLIAGAYKALGKSYLEQKLFVKGVDAFTMALKISDDAGYNSIDILFMVGDAYQKANSLEKAKEAFEKVAQTEDSIWARLAKERLTTLALAEKVSSS